MLPHNERYHIAWFKLAELVARKERERALVVYRLLVHSWNDQAYALQLKGDLLSAFHDKERAREAYCLAAESYEKSDRSLYAAFLYEQLLEQEYSDNLLMKTITIFAICAKPVQLKRCAAYIRNDLMVNWLQLFLSESIMPEISRVLLQEYLLMYMLHVVQGADRHEMQRNVHSFVSALLQSESEEHLAPFLAKLAATDLDLHQFACNIIEQASL